MRPPGHSLGPHHAGLDPADLELRCEDDVSLQELVAVLDTCRSQGFTALRVAPY